MNNKLLSFGHGYSAHALERLLPFDDWKISATTRSLEKSNVINNCKVSAFIWPGTDLVSEIKNATHILLSIPPNMDGDPVFLEYGNTIASSKNLKWIGYLSTTGVYGDHRGGWVDENTPLKPTTERGIKRLLAEQQWLEVPNPDKIDSQIEKGVDFFDDKHGGAVGFTTKKENNLVSQYETSVYNVLNDPDNMDINDLQQELLKNRDNLFKQLGMLKGELIPVEAGQPKSFDFEKAFDVEVATEPYKVPRVVPLENTLPKSELFPAIADDKATA